MGVNVAKEGLKFSDSADEEQIKAWETEFQPLTDYIKKQMGDKLEKVTVTDRLTKTPSAIVTTAQGWTAQMEKLVKAQALADKSMANMYKPKKVMELNPLHPIVIELNRLVQENEDDESAPDVVKLFTILPHFDQVSLLKMPIYSLIELYLLSVKILKLIPM